jgi:glucose-1-phosphate adenylyltransferase
MAEGERGDGRMVGVIMGGGRGTRLYPLTKDRAKPAVPIASKYRLIDIPISNCVNSGMKRIYVLTQFNSFSLHRHISETYKFDQFSGGFVEILAAEQTYETEDWYQGTADAVRKNLRHFGLERDDRALVLSGDQLYRMDFRLLVAYHEAHKAQVTVATVPVKRSGASDLGLLDVTGTGRIKRFVEKPRDPAMLDRLEVSATLPKKFGLSPGRKRHLANMGIYLFDRKVIEELLSDWSLTDFGKEVIPSAIAKYRCYAYLFDGYWQDIGTIPAFFEANLALTRSRPPYDFYDPEGQIYTRPRFLPGTKLFDSTAHHVIFGDGCIITRSHIEDSVVGLRSIVEEGCRIRRSVLMGADYFETDHEKREARKSGIPKIGIGPSSENSRSGEASRPRNTLSGTVSPSSSGRRLSRTTR